VSEKGDICVNTLKKDWNPAKWSLSHILSVIRCLLIIPFPESSLNEEAGKLFMDDYQEYVRMAKMMTKIHAKQQKSVAKEIESIENDNTYANDSYENRDEEEAKDGFIGVASRFHFKKNSNLDASMEEEKEPLQNLNCNYNMNNHNQIYAGVDKSLGNESCNNSILMRDQDYFTGEMEKEQSMDIKSFQQPAKGVLSGSSLFGAKAVPCNKKKKMRRI